ncbi:MAG: Gfo/Idh/MocA family protein [Fimbriimonas sp.]
MAREFSRRDVLAGMGAFALSPGLSDPFFQDKPVGWAVLGLGGYAQWMMPAIVNSTRGKLVGLISGTPAKLEKYGAQYGVDPKNRYSYERMDEIADNPAIEVVYVITPPATHPAFAMRAAKLGKHVCCEKPMAPTVAECQAIIDASKKAGKLLQIGYRSHYEMNNMRAMNLCRSGELGKIKSVSSDHGFDMGRGQWRLDRKLAGGGSMMDIGIYSLQALRYLTGMEPKSVTATITNPLGDDRFGEGMEDTVNFSLQFPNGLVGKGTSGYSWNPGKNQYEVVLEKGTLRAEPATNYRNNRLTLDGKLVDLIPNDQFPSQIDHFSECIRTGRKVRTPGEEGLRDIRLIRAIYESARTGKSVPV